MSIQPELPRVVLLGDSIRMGYAPLVERMLRERAVVLHPGENCGDSSRLLAHLHEWAAAPRPLLVHLNCGLHDLKLNPNSGEYQVPLARYVENLRAIVTALRAETAATILFATTTPVHDERHAARNAGFARREADVVRYNAAARQVLRELGVPLHCLHSLVHEQGAATLLSADGVHFTPEGNALLAGAVADAVRRHLAILLPPSMPAPPAGPTAAAAYRAEEARRDALVPAWYRRLPVPEFRPPTTAPEWARNRPRVLAAVEATLGELPPRPERPRARLVSRELHPGFTLERLALDNAAGGEIPLLLLLPEGQQAPAPAVLWLHSSTPDKNQVLTPGTFWGARPLGVTLARRGYVVCAPDAWWRGDRAGTGPAGPAESRRDEQESLLKVNLWLGRTLWGMFVRDDRIVLDYLHTRPEVDAARVGAVGMSLGSTRAWWLAALDERLATAVAIACLTRYQNLLAHGQLREHGVYYFVYGLLRHFDVEAVLSLIAPRPLLALTGELDAGSPADGVRDLERPVAATYAALGAAERFRSVLYPEVGHTVTAAMLNAMHAWLDRHLHPPRP